VVNTEISGTKTFGKHSTTGMPYFSRPKPKNKLTFYHVWFHHPEVNGFWVECLE